MIVFASSLSSMRKCWVGVIFWQDILYNVILKPTLRNRKLGMVVPFCNIGVPAGKEVLPDSKKCVVYFLFCPPPPSD